MSLRRPLVIVTRKLPDAIETRMMELFDARLNEQDRPFSKAELIEAIKGCDVLVPTVTDKIDSAVLAHAGDADPARLRVDRVLHELRQGLAGIGLRAGQPADELEGIGRLQTADDRVRAATGAAGRTRSGARKGTSLTNGRPRSLSSSMSRAR